MFKNIEEVISAINNAHFYDMEDMPEELYEKLENNDFKFLKAENYKDVHRWYEINKDIYTIKLDDGIHYLGIYYCGNIFSEMMSLSDVDYEIECCECIAVPSVAYIDKDESEDK